MRKASYGGRSPRTLPHCPNALKVTSRHMNAREPCMRRRVKLSMPGSGRLCSEESTACAWPSEECTASALSTSASSNARPLTVSGEPYSSSRHGPSELRGPALWKLRPSVPSQKGWMWRENSTAASSRWIRKPLLVGACFVGEPAGCSATGAAESAAAEAAPNSPATVATAAAPLASAAPPLPADDASAPPASPPAAGSPSDDAAATAPVAAADAARASLGGSVAAAAAAGSLAWLGCAAPPSALALALALSALALLPGLAGAWTSVLSANIF
mmetsp:Transcript_9140/g.33527  ORF Transcript_9140/g.33527 Transcript_9140/m.33527 type:complete len:273 (-) Transcript_9140:1081-1899(-)